MYFLNLFTAFAYKYIIFKKGSYACVNKQQHTVNKQQFLVNGGGATSGQHDDSDYNTNRSSLYWLTFTSRWFTPGWISQTRYRIEEDLPTFSG